MVSQNCITVFKITVIDIKSFSIVLFFILWFTPLRSYISIMDRAIQIFLMLTYNKALTYIHNLLS